jgi:hypothetical protein
MSNSIHADARQTVRIGADALSGRHTTTVMQIQKRFSVSMRAALLEADRRPLLYGVICEAASPDLNCEILDGNRTIGRATAGAWSRVHQRPQAVVGSLNLRYLPGQLVLR